MSTWDSKAQRDEEITPGRFAGLRSLTSQLVGRAQLANWSGFSFKGARDMFHALGYDRLLTPRMYRWRYERGGIVGRLVDAYPMATWRGGGEIIEDEDPDTLTEFENEWDKLNKRLGVWSVLESADILCQLGRYAVILLGAPGVLEEPLTRLSAKDLVYMSPFSERDSKIESLDTDTASPRFGRPVFYNFSRLTAPLEGIAPSLQRRVHWTRVVHLAENTLDDRIYGLPRMERIWNLLDDLDKVVGGGAEAFWKRVDAGIQLKLDPNIADMTTADKKALDDQLEEYTNGLRRILRTRGIDINPLSSATAGIKDPVTTIVSLLSAATAIPQRILLGSERGELASSQDRDEWMERVQDRRVNFANTQVVRPMIDRFIELGVLPEPKQFEARWPMKKTLTDPELVVLAKDAANANQMQGETIITVGEIRDKYLNLPPIEEVMTPEELAAEKAGKLTAVPVAGELDGNGDPLPPSTLPEQTPAKPPIPAKKRAAKWAVLTAAEKVRYNYRVNAAKGKEQQFKPIHATADRFSRRRSEARVASVR